MKVLSLGAGVNSVALLVLKSQGKVDFDLAIFADTGCEHPETYEYIETIIKPFCAKQNLPLVVVGGSETLYEYSWKYKTVPGRIKRYCTDKFKIRPIKKYLMQHYPDENITQLLGIDAGESHRAKDGCANEYPLIDLGIDREGCKKIILDAGLPLPIKSGCYFCPFKRVSQWKWLKRKHPEHFAKAVALEKNATSYPTWTLHQGKTLEEVVSKTELCDWLGEVCAMCEVQ